MHNRYFIHEPYFLYICLTVSNVVLVNYKFNTGVNLHVTFIHKNPLLGSKDLIYFISSHKLVKVRLASTMPTWLCICKKRVSVDEIPLDPLIFWICPLEAQVTLRIWRDISI